jgi:uncharacterized membrane protein
MYVDRRPVLKLEYGLFEMIAEAAGAAALIAGLFVLTKYWAALPQIIPTHFGFSGQADSWGSKSTLLALSAVTVVMYLALTLLSRVPHIYNYACDITEQNSEFQYRNSRRLMLCLKAEVTAIFAYMQFRLVLIALGKASGMGMLWFFASMAAVMATVIWFVYRSLSCK